jgi:integrase
MARTLNRLTALAVSRAKDRGLYADGGGLALQVSKAGARSWVFRFMRDGRERCMGLGSLNSVGLAKARIKAAAARELLADGKDPIAIKDAQRAALAPAMTFQRAAAEFIAAHRSGWRSAAHAVQWEVTLATFAEPLIGALPVQAINTDHVTAVLLPIWQDKPETASRLRGRVESILDWATARKFRSGDNPARWKGHLEYLLPARVRKVEHHAALAYAKLPEFMIGLRAQQGVAAQALELTILTAARSGEILGAKWSEFDLAAFIWTIGSGRMKAARVHRVPLSDAALAVLNARPRDGEYVFPGLKRGKPISKMAMPDLLERMGHPDCTVHGFRSSFRDWAAEQTDYAGDVVEAALAHAVRSKVEAAYRRGDLFEKRRELMDEWAATGRLATLKKGKRRPGRRRCAL